MSNKQHNGEEIVLPVTSRLVDQSLISITPSFMLCIRIIFSLKLLLQYSMVLMFFVVSLSLLFMWLYK